MCQINPRRIVLMRPKNAETAVHWLPRCPGDIGVGMPMVMKHHGAGDSNRFESVVMRILSFVPDATVAAIM